MTNTEIRIGGDLEELALDGADALEKRDERVRDAEIRELPAYAFDSESRTLVGLGPVERARRSRGAAEIPDRERMPQSEPPGPFIADDDEDLSRALRGRPLGPWAMAVPVALVMAAAAVAVGRALPSRAPHAGKPAVAAVEPPTTLQVAPTIETVNRSEPSLTPERDSGEAAEAAPAEANDPREAGEAQAVPARSEGAPRGTGWKVPSAPPVLPVKLPELPPPTVIDMSDSADSNVGTLEVTSSPPSNVVLDGRPLGQSPRLVQVPAGTHTVVFIHPLYGRQSRRVNVGAGRTASASADF